LEGTLVYAYLCIKQITDMKNTDIYYTEHGVKTTKKLDKIIAAAQNHMRRNFRGYEVNGITFGDFLDTKRMSGLRNRFEAEVERIGGVDYYFGDCLC